MNKQEELKSAEEILFSKNDKLRITSDLVISLMEEYADQFKKQLKEKEDEIEKIIEDSEKLLIEKNKQYFLRLRSETELKSQLTKSNEMNERLAEALEDSVNGLIWFQEEYPSSYSENNKEHLSKCKDILNEYQNSKK